MNLLRKGPSGRASTAMFFAFSLTLVACHKQSAPAPAAQPSVQVATPAAAPAAPVAPAVAVVPADWKVVSSAKGGFTIAFPKKLDGKETDPSATGMTPGVRFSLDVPDSFEPKTNFGNATLTVGASGGKAALAQCMKQEETDGDPVRPKNVDLNGAPFTVFSSTNMGCGSAQDTTSYRIVHAGQCYAVNYTISSANINNYDPADHIKNFDDSKVTALMESIVATFKFQ
jgi:hypothetical protein